jgi:hypothetical protein
MKNTNSNTNSNSQTSDFANNYDYQDSNKYLKYGSLEYEDENIRKYKVAKDKQEELKASQNKNKRGIKMRNIFLKEVEKFSQKYKINWNLKDYKKEITDFNTEDLNEKNIYNFLINENASELSNKNGLKRKEIAVMQYLDIEEHDDLMEVLCETSTMEFLYNNFDYNTYGETYGDYCDIAYNWIEGGLGTYEGINLLKLGLTIKEIDGYYDLDDEIKTDLQEYIEENA